MTGSNLQPGGIAANDAAGVIYISGPWLGGVDSVVCDSTVLYLPPYSTDPIFILAYDMNGNVLCGATLASGGDDENSVCADPSGNAFVTGDFLSDGIHPFIVGADTISWGSDPAQTNGLERVFTSKFNCDLKTATGIEQIVSNAVLTLYPDPATTRATVKYTLPYGSIANTLVIYDILGHCLSDYTLVNTAGEININCQGLSSGVYFYSLVFDGKTILTRKMVVAE